MVGNHRGAAPGRVALAPHGQLAKLQEDCSCSAWVTGESHSSGQELILQSVSSETFSEC